jgi:hypothetical protein
MTTTDPSVVGRVLDAAREMARALRLVTAIGGALSKPGDTLVAAVDALDSDHPVEPSVGATLGTILGAVGGASQTGEDQAGVDRAVRDALRHIGYDDPDVDPATERDFDTAAAAVPVAVVGTPPWQVHDSPPPTHGTPAADPDSGPGWDRDTIADLARCLRTVGYTPLTPDAGRVADQLDALLAERDRLLGAWQHAMDDGDDQTMQRLVLHGDVRDVRAEADRWRQRAETAEARVDGQAWAELSAERDRYRVEAATAWDAAGDMAAIEELAAIEEGATRLRVELVEAERDRLERLAAVDRQTMVWMQSEINRQHTAGTAWRQRAEEVTADRAAALVTIDALRDELATVCADAAADALDWAAAEWDRRAFGMNEWPTVGNLATWAAEVRAGQRTIPTQPATTSIDPEGNPDEH